MVVEWLQRGLILTCIPQVLPCDMGDLTGQGVGGPTDHPHLGQESQWIISVLQLLNLSSSFSWKGGDALSKSLCLF